MKVPTITLKDLVNKLKSGEPFLFWNVLTDDYFKGESIPGSERVPLDRIGRELNRRGLSKEADIVVYCSGPTCPQSKAAAEKLQTLGYKKAVAFEGGLQEWKEAGYDLQLAA